MVGEILRRGSGLLPVSTKNSVRSVEAWGLYTFFLEILVNYVYFHVWCNNFWLSHCIIIVSLVGVLSFGTNIWYRPYSIVIVASAIEFLHGLLGSVLSGYWALCSL